MPSAGPDSLVFEKTPDYMAVPIVPKRIFEMKPDVKLIVATCDSVKRAFSNYLHLTSVERPMDEVAPGVQLVMNSTFDEAIFVALKNSIGEEKANLIFEKPEEINEKKREEIRETFTSFASKIWDDNKKFPMPEGLLGRASKLYFHDESFICYLPQITRFTTQKARFK